MIQDKKITESSAFGARRLRRLRRLRSEWSEWSEWSAVNYESLSQNYPK